MYFQFFGPTKKNSSQQRLTAPYHILSALRNFCVMNFRLCFSLPYFFLNAEIEFIYIYPIEIEFIVTLCVYLYFCIQTFLRFVTSNNHFVFGTVRLCILAELFDAVRRTVVCNAFCRKSFAHIAYTVNKIE